MTETLWSLLAGGTVAFTVACGVVTLLRPVVRRLAGAMAQRRLWLLLPATLLALLLGAWRPMPTTWQLPLPASELAPVAPPAMSGHATDGPAFDGRHALLVGWSLGALVLAVALRQRQRQVARGEGPALVGAWRPRLLLPAAFRQCFPPQERRLILLHERVHAEHGDTRWLLLANSLLVLQWFNPLAWWAMVRLRADLELACDATVLQRRPDALSAYRRALLRAHPGAAPLLPGLITACNAHPLIERIAMLPLHISQPRRRGLVACLVLAASGLAYAAQSAIPVAPPMQDGYSKLRIDLLMSVNGRALEPVVLLETFKSSARHAFDLGNGHGIEVYAEGRPHRDPAIADGEEVLMLNLLVLDLKTRMLLAKPRIATKDGVPARIEFGNEGERVVRLDMLPRVVRTRLHDGTGARAELLREIAAGTAPANYFTR